MGGVVGGEKGLVSLTGHQGGDHPRLGGTDPHPTARLPPPDTEQIDPQVWARGACHAVASTQAPLPGDGERSRLQASGVPLSLTHHLAACG